MGCFNACAGTMRSRYIPEDVQAAVMNLGRVPLNLLVVGGTYLSDAAPAQVAFAAVAAGVLGRRGAAGGAGAREARLGAAYYVIIRSVLVFLGKEGMPTPFF